MSAARSLSCPILATAVNVGRYSGVADNGVGPIATGSFCTAFRLFADMKSGILEGFQSMQIVRSSVLWAHVLTSVVSNLIPFMIVAARHAAHRC